MKLGTIGPKRGVARPQRVDIGGTARAIAPFAAAAGAGAELIFKARERKKEEADLEYKQSQIIAAEFRDKKIIKDSNDE